MWSEFRIDAPLCCMPGTAGHRSNGILQAQHTGRKLRPAIYGSEAGH